MLEIQPRLSIWYWFIQTGGFFDLGGGGDLIGGAGFFALPLLDGAGVRGISVPLLLEVRVGWRLLLEGTE